MGAYPIPVVRALVTNTDGRVLVLKRSATDHGAGSWCLPGGKIEYGQTVEAALAYELAEETSLQLVDAEFFLLQDNLPLRAGAMHCINLYFVCRGAGEIQVNEESAAAAWIGPHDLDRYEIVFRNDEAIRRYFDGAARAV